MAEQSNIEQFNQLVADTLAELYQAFPLRTYLSVYEYGVDQEAHELIDCSEANMIAQRRADFVIDTWRWLADSGYIKVDDFGFAFASNVVLTAQGLHVLSATPDSLHPKETLGDKLQSALKTGTREVALEAVKQVMGLGVSLLR